MVSPPTAESESVETKRLPVVSNLKSHFEQIANANSQTAVSKKPTVSGLGFPTSTGGLLSADRSVSLCQRTFSSDLHFQVDDHDGGQRPAVHLRSASSSDLKSSKRPPPPPPPIRATKLASPSTSPYLRSVQISSLPNPSTSPTKRPPPPIPSSPVHKSDSPLPQAGNAAPVRGRFPRFGKLNHCTAAVANTHINMTAMPINRRPTSPISLDLPTAHSFMMEIPPSLSLPRFP